MIVVFYSSKFDFFFGFQEEMHYLFNIIRLLVVSAVVVFLFIITSGFILILVAVGFIYYKYITWSKKTCSSCGRRINNKVIVCKYCGTIDDS